MHPRFGESLGKYRAVFWLILIPQVFVVSPLPFVLVVSCAGSFLWSCCCCRVGGLNARVREFSWGVTPSMSGMHVNGWWFHSPVAAIYVFVAILTALGLSNGTISRGIVEGDKRDGSDEKICFEA